MKQMQCGYSYKFRTQHNCVVQSKHSAVKFCPEWWLPLRLSGMGEVKWVSGHTVTNKMLNNDQNQNDCDKYYWNLGQGDTHAHTNIKPHFCGSEQGTHSYTGVQVAGKLTRNLRFPFIQEMFWGVKNWSTSRSKHQKVKLKGGDEKGSYITGGLKERAN